MANKNNDTFPTFFKHPDNEWVSLGEPFNFKNDYLSQDPDDPVEVIKTELNELKDKVAKLTQRIEDMESTKGIYKHGSIWVAKINVNRLPLLDLLEKNTK